MKLVIYQLTESGRIPDYIVDGGYFHNADYDLVGVATEDAPQDALSKESFIEYVTTFCKDFIDPITEEITPVALIAENFWLDKME